MTRSISGVDTSEINWILVVEKDVSRGVRQLENHSNRRRPSFDLFARPSFGPAPFAARVCWSLYVQL